VSEFAKWFLVVMLALGALLTVSDVGKPRTPTTSGTATLTVLFSALYIVLIVAFWGQS
jgi:hypothetical protein